MSINIISEPTVRLVGHQTIDGAELAGFLADEDAESWITDTDEAAQKLVEVAGRLCYKSYAKPRPGGNAAYIEHILEVGHGSVIEHAVYNFIITGVSRSFSHELVRHRAGWAYSQRSQRFCDESELSVVVPPALLPHKAEWDQWKAEDRRWSGLHEDDSTPEPTASPRACLFNTWRTSVIQSQVAYRMLADGLAAECDPLADKTLRRKRAREAARSVLPNATETQLFVTLNARAGRHFIEARGDEHADAEIRAVALAMLSILQGASPNLFGDYVVEDRGGVKVATTPHRKV